MSPLAINVINVMTFDNWQDKFLNVMSFCNATLTAHLLQIKVYNKLVDQIFFLVWRIHFYYVPATFYRSYLLPESDDILRHFWTGKYSLSANHLTTGLCHTDCVTRNISSNKVCQWNYKIHLKTGELANYQWPKRTCDISCDHEMWTRTRVKFLASLARSC